MATIALSSCEDGVQIDLPEDELSYSKYFDAKLDPSKLCSDIKVAKSNGGILKGTRDCKIPTTGLCEESGTTGCYLTNPKLYGLDPKDHVAENFRKDVTVAEVTGNQVANDTFCTADGDDTCVATRELPSITKDGAAAKVAEGHEILGVEGKFVPDFPEAANVMQSAKTGKDQGTLGNCTDAKATGCVLTTAYRAVAPSALIPADIKSGEVIGAVSGNYTTSLPNCSASDQTGCITTARFAAVEKSRVIANNIETGYRVLSTNGAVRPRPGECTADNQTNCVAAAPHKAIDKSTINAGLLRKGVKVAGVTGDFPSASHPLAGADGAVADLTSGSFAAKIKSSDSFELWDATGRRYVLQGSDKLAPERIVSGTTIFGVAGNLATKPANCATDGEDGCVAHAGFPAINKSTVTPGVLRKGVKLAGVTGAYPSAAHRLESNTARADMSYPSDLRSGSSFEFFDATGAVHTASGSADLASGNIVSGITLFGVNGSAIATPADCTSHDQQGCVADSGHPAYKKSTLTAAVIKKGVKLSGITGIFPSASSRLLGASSSTADLTAGDFVSRISSNSTFEFWDATGARHRVSGDAGLNSGNILTGVTIFGKAGALKNQPPECSLATKNCLTTASYPSYDPAVLTEAVLKNGVKLGEVTGRYPSTSYRLPNAGTTVDLTASNFNSRLRSVQNFEYWNAYGQRFSAKGDDDLVASNLRQGQKLFGVTGTALSSAANCTAENAKGCVTTSGFPSYEKAKLSPANIKKDVNLLGVVGTYPSGGNRLPGANSTPDLSAAYFDTAMKNSANFEFYNAAGVRQTAFGFTKLKPANLTQGTTIFTVAGTIAPAPAACTGRNQKGCLANATFPAFQKSALSPSVLKKGVTLYGVVGAYPSGTFPLAEATSTPDLTGANFTTRHQSSLSFEYFDAAGNRHTGAGDNDLQPENISKGVNILGVEGNFLGTSSDIAWNIRYGETVAGIAGRVKPNCRNMAHYFYFKDDGIYDNIDDENLKDKANYPDDNPWGSSAVQCGADVYEDVSYNTSTHQPTSCQHHRNDIACMHKDRISGLTWHEAIPGGSSGMTWSSADNYCRNLTEAGHSDWRLPTRDESIAAHVNGIHRLKMRFSVRNFAGDEMGQTYRTNYATWTTNNQFSGNSSYKTTVNMAHGGVSYSATSSTMFFHCVRD